MRRNFSVHFSSFQCWLSLLLSGWTFAAFAACVVPSIRLFPLVYYAAVNSFGLDIRPGTGLVVG